MMKHMSIKLFFFLLILAGSLILTGCIGEECSFHLDGNPLTYTGDIENGTGTLYSGLSKVYEGQFVNGYINGQGKLYSGGRVKYEGQFVDQKPLGQGIIYNSKGKKMFEGTITHNDGINYTGTGYLHNERGEVVYQGTITVRGDTVELASSGKLFYPTGELMYEGQLANGEPSGSGTFYGIEGNVLFTNR